MKINFVRKVLAIVVLALLLGGAYTLAQAAPAVNSCVSSSDGNWNAATTWTPTCGSTFPQTGDSATIDKRTVTLNVSTNTLADFTITDGTLTAGANTITLNGNWTKGSSGTFTAGTGTVVFNGTATSTTLQTFSGNTTFNNLTVNSSAIVETGTSLMTVGGTYLNNGQIRHTPTTARACGTAEVDGTNNNTATLSSCVTLINATIKSAAGGGFPNVTIGSSTKYGDCPANSDLVHRYWLITPHAAGSAIVNFVYRDTELTAGGFTTSSALTLYKCVGTTWTSVAGPLTQSAAATTGYHQVTTGSAITIGAGGNAFALGGPSVPTAVKVETFTATSVLSTVQPYLLPVTLGTLGIVVLGLLAVMFLRPR